MVSIIAISSASWCRQRRWQNTAKKVAACPIHIDLGLASFRNDYGDYPSSNWWSRGSDRADYCAQKLAERCWAGACSAPRILRRWTARRRMGGDL
jgi:hypothetical protein